jgi:hypothetical protein
MDAARKATLYREVNMTTEAMLRQFDADDAGLFLCECQDADCSRRLPLRHAEFEAVRASGGFLVTLECIADAEVLLRADCYAAVAFRSALTGGAAGPSPTESSRSESSRQASSRQAPSGTALSGTALSRSALSRSALSRSTLSGAARSRPQLSSSVASRRAALRLVTSGQWPATPAEVLPGRLWHRQSQSARLLAPSVPLPEPPPRQPRGF